MIAIHDVEAKALKKIYETESELSFLLYMEALGFVIANVSKKKLPLLHYLTNHEVEMEEYQKGLGLQVTGKYDFDSRRLHIAEYEFTKNA